MFRDQIQDDCVRRQCGAATFALGDGRYEAFVGTTFKSGYIINQTYGGESWVTYESYDAYVDHLEMVTGARGHNVSYDGRPQTTAGLLLAAGNYRLARVVEWHRGQ